MSQSLLTLNTSDDENDSPLPSPVFKSNLKTDQKFFHDQIPSCKNQNEAKDIDETGIESLSPDEFSKMKVLESCSVEIKEKDLRAGKFSVINDLVQESRNKFELKEPFAIEESKPVLSFRKCPTSYRSRKSNLSKATPTKVKKKIELIKKEVRQVIENEKIPKLDYSLKSKAVRKPKIIRPILETKQKKDAAESPSSSSLDSSFGIFVHGDQIICAKRPDASNKDADINIDRTKEQEKENISSANISRQISADKKINLNPKTPTKQSQSRYFTVDLTKPDRSSHVDVSDTSTRDNSKTKTNSLVNSESIEQPLLSENKMVYQNNNQSLKRSESTICIDIDVEPTSNLKSKIIKSSTKSSKDTSQTKSKTQNKKRKRRTVRGKQALPSVISNTTELQHSNSQIEKSLISEIRKLEKQGMFLMSQKNKLMRQLKQFQSKLFKQYDSKKNAVEHSSDDRKSRFLPDAAMESEYEMFLHGDPPLPESSMKAAQKVMFSFHKTVQPTLTQMIKERNNETTETVKVCDLEDKSCNKIKNDDSSEDDEDIDEIMKQFPLKPNETEEYLMQHYSTSDVSLKNFRLHHDGWNWITTGTKSKQVVETLNQLREETMKTYEDDIDSKERGRNGEDKEYNMQSHIQEKNIARNETCSQVGKETNYTSILQHTLSSIEEGGMNYLLKLLEECPRSSNIKINDLSCASQYPSTSNDVLQSQLTQQGQEIVQQIESKLSMNSEKLEMIQKACPSWRENIRYAQLRKDVAGVQDALKNVQRNITDIKFMKEKILKAWEEQVCVLELFKSSLEQSCMRLESKEKICECIDAEIDEASIQNDDVIEFNTIVELSDNDDVKAPSPKPKHCSSKVRTRDHELYSLNIFSSKSKLSPVLSEDNVSEGDSTNIPEDLRNSNPEIMPDYNNMDENTLKTLLLNYGFRPTSKKEMVQRLIEIFDKNKNQARETVTGVFSEVYPTSSISDNISIQNGKNQNINKKVNKSKSDYSMMETEELKRLISNYGLKPSSRTQMTNLLNQIQEQESIFQSNSSNPLPRCTIPKSSKTTSTSNKNNSNSIFTSSHRDDYHSFQQKCMEAIRSNEDLHVSILERKTIELTQIQECMQENGISVQKSQLIDLLDDAGVLVGNRWRQKKRHDT